MKFLVKLFLLVFSVSSFGSVNINHSLIRCYETSQQGGPQNINFIFEVFENHESILPRLGYPWTSDLMAQCQQEEPGNRRACCLHSLESGANPHLRFCRTQGQSINKLTPIQVAVLSAGEVVDETLVYCEKGIGTWVHGIPFDK